MVRASCGFLLGEKGITINDIFDPATGRYKLMLGVPRNPEPAKKPSAILAIIDSGVLKDHPQLKGLIVGEKDFTGEGPEDKNGHGTMVALRTLLSRAEVKAKTKSEIPSFGILNVKVANKESEVKKEDVIKAIKWAAKNGANVVNLSLGFEGGEGEHQDLCRTIRSFKEVSFCAAAGNKGPQVKVYPASCSAPNLMSVGALSAGALADYSGKGDIYCKGTAVLADPAYYFYEEGDRAARSGEIKKAKEFYTKALQEKKIPQALSQLVAEALKKLERSL